MLLEYVHFDYFYSAFFAHEESSLYLFPLSNTYFSHIHPMFFLQVLWEPILVQL